MKENGTGEPTPEQLLQIIDAEITLRRSHSTNNGRNRAIILVVGILFIVIAAGAALLILDQMLADYRNTEHPPRQAAGETHGNF
jgi:hypothetical protein